jgi:hypothetical protein
MSSDHDSSQHETGQHSLNRRNDARLLTPLLLMAAIVALGFLVYSLTGHALAAAG